MSYSELIHNFNRTRDYMREFYVYGFKSRKEYTQKSARTYDNERRRLENWMDGYMQFYRRSDGKNTFFSIDSRNAKHNPLYQAWKAKSSTDKNTALHFIVMDILSSAERPLTIDEIVGKIDGYVFEFKDAYTFDTETVRKKLQKYQKIGIVKGEKNRKQVYYSCEKRTQMYDSAILDFFSEVSPCGVIGSFLLDQMGAHDESPFTFKHHYITGAMDSEIVCQLFAAMKKQCSITVETTRYYEDIGTKNDVVPLRIFISVQNGRQYLMAYVPKLKRILAFRTDHIVSVKEKDVCERFEKLREQLHDMQSNVWGVSLNQKSTGLERVCFTVHYEDNEQYIHHRLEREKRCGTVEKLDNNTSRFTAELYDSNEIFPWIRTFICRITHIEFSNKDLEKRFRNDINTMYEMYGVGTEELV